ncbi:MULTISPECIES: hypothetical protein [Actinosynnema]|uniref:hypothetical protein n=1 Tax=Actinosynnema TaxID=40566 RepID=UPI0020A4CBEA|nr:hypothetical protein [Actinosynnema pretiosum]MCP2097321.1 hypothetical protein [Actinosynnema pretiosum]
MGYSYYAVDTGLAAVERWAGHETGLHIGCASAHWEFLFRAHPDEGLVDCAAWRALLERPGVRIMAESGYEVPLEQFWPEAILRPAQAPGGHHAMNSWSDQWRADRQPTGREHWTNTHGHPFEARPFH